MSVVWDGSAMQSNISQAKVICKLYRATMDVIQQTFSHGCKASVSINCYHSQKNTTKAASDEQSCECLKSVILWLFYLLASVYNFKFNSGFYHHSETCVVFLLQYCVLMVKMEKLVGYSLQGISELRLIDCNLDRGLRLNRSFCPDCPPPLPVINLSRAVCIN